MEIGQKVRITGKSYHHFEIGQVVSHTGVVSDAGNLSFIDEHGLKQWVPKGDYEVLEVCSARASDKKKRHVYQYDLIDAETKRALQSGIPNREMAREEKRYFESRAGKQSVKILQRKMSVVEERVIR